MENFNEPPFLCRKSKWKKLVAYQCRLDRGMLCKQTFVSNSTSSRLKAFDFFFEHLLGQRLPILSSFFILWHFSSTISGKTSEENFSQSRELWASFGSENRKVSNGNSIVLRFANDVKLFVPLRVSWTPTISMSQTSTYELRAQIFSRKLFSVFVFIWRLTKRRKKTFFLLFLWRKARMRFWWREICKANTTSVWSRHMRVGESVVGSYRTYDKWLWHAFRFLVW